MAVSGVRGTTHGGSEWRQGRRFWVWLWHHTTRRARGPSWTAFSAAWISTSAGFRFLIYRSSTRLRFLLPCCPPSVGSDAGHRVSARRQQAMSGIAMATRRRGVGDGNIKRAWGRQGGHWWAWGCLGRWWWPGVGALTIAAPSRHGWGENVWHPKNYSI